MFDMIDGILKGLAKAKSLMKQPSNAAASKPQISAFRRSFNNFHQFRNF